MKSLNNMKTDGAARRFDARQWPLYFPKWQLAWAAFGLSDKIEPWPSLKFRSALNPLRPVANFGVKFIMAIGLRER